MVVKNPLVEQIVEQVLNRLAGEETRENILILQNRSEVSEKNLPVQTSTSSRLYFMDDDLNNILISKYILPQLEPGDLADLAQGKPGSGKVAGVLELLLAGKCVEVLEYTHSRFEDTAPPPLMDLYQQHVETLVSYGLKPYARPAKTANTSSRVISERDVEKFHREGFTCIRIGAKSLITPLAREHASQCGIKLQYEN